MHYSSGGKFFKNKKRNFLRGNIFVAKVCREFEKLKNTHCAVFCVLSNHVNIKSNCWEFLKLWRILQIFEVQIIRFQQSFFLNLRKLLVLRLKFTQFRIRKVICEYWLNLSLKIWDKIIYNNFHWSHIEKNFRVILNSKQMLKHVSNVLENSTILFPKYVGIILLSHEDNLFINFLANLKNISLKNLKI